MKFENSGGLHKPVFWLKLLKKVFGNNKKVAQTSSEYFRHFHSPLPYTDFNILFGNEKYTASVTPLHSYFISMVDYITPLITLIMGVINDRTCLKMVLVDSTYTQNMDIGIRIWFLSQLDQEVYMIFKIIANILKFALITS